jgi:hypothetical protein
MCMQMDYVRGDVKNVSTAVKDAVPANDSSSVDLSALTNAEKQLDGAYGTVQQREKDVRNYLRIVKTVIFVAGACAFALGIFGFITLIARVCALLCPTL